jgi:hypothetical protein
MPHQLGSLLWKKSTASGSAGCVEVARAEGKVFVRDSKVPSESFLSFSEQEWEEFLVGVRGGRFDI